MPIESRHRYIVVLITVPSEDVGERIARELVERGLAACVNILPPMRSIYTWKGQVTDDREMLLLVKSRSDVFEQQLVPAVKAMHPYDVPEIIALPILMGTEEYLGWVEESVRNA